MKQIIVKIWPYLLASLLVIGFWMLRTSTDNYAWDPQGKETTMLDIALTFLFFHKALFWLVAANLLVLGLLQLTKKNYKTAGVVIVLTCTYYFTLARVIDQKCAFFYYMVFQNQSVSEEYMLRPIEEAGYAIGPLLTGNIADENMKHRRYAILGLQKINYEPATERLGVILFDPSEQDFYRQDAYEALKTFNNERAKKLIEEYENQVIDTKEGITALLPERPEFEKPEPVEVQNQLLILVSEDNKLYVNGVVTHKSELRNVAKHFITQTSDKTEVELPLIGKQLVSKGVIYIQNEKGTDYSLYIACQNELKAAYRELLEEYALKFFNTKWNNLESDKMDIIIALVPQRIQEGVPEE